MRHGIRLGSRQLRARASLIRAPIAHSRACASQAAAQQPIPTPPLPSANEDADTDEVRPADQGMKPREIMAELDRYIVGQSDAKRAVAVAMRNRWRRQQVASPLREDIMPKNILMIGPTGVGKTEVARRLAKLANAPFIKVSVL